MTCPIASVGLASRQPDNELVTAKDRLEVVHHRIARPDASLDRGTDVTEIIAFDEFGAMVDVAGSHGDPFAIDYEVLSAPELDDLNDVADESPRLLLLPKGESNAATPAVPIPIDGASAREGQRLSGRAALKGVSVRSSRGAHRRTGWCGTGAGGGGGDLCVRRGGAWPGAQSGRRRYRTDGDLCRQRPGTLFLAGRVTP